MQNLAVFHWCYVNDLHTTTCSGMLGHRRFAVNYFCLYVVFELGKGCGVAVAAAAIDLSSTVTCAKSRIW